MQGNRRQKVFGRVHLTNFAAYATGLLVQSGKRKRRLSGASSSQRKYQNISPEYIEADSDAPNESRFHIIIKWKDRKDKKKKTMEQEILEIIKETREKLRIRSYDEERQELEERRKQEEDFLKWKKEKLQRIYINEIEEEDKKREREREKNEREWKKQREELRRWAEKNIICKIIKIIKVSCFTRLRTM